MRQILLLLALLLAEGATVQAQSLPKPDREAVAAAGLQVVEGGPALHPSSHVSFPAELEGFRRVQVNAIGRDDVFANYSAIIDGREATATVYLFRPGDLPEHALKGSIRAFATRMPEAFVWSAGPFDVAAATPLHLDKITFKTGIGPGTSLDYLYFADLGAWRVKVRGSLSGPKEPAEEARLDAFVTNLPWKEVLAAAGTCSGKACSAPPFERFTSHFGEMVFADLYGKKIPFDAKAEKNLPVAIEADIRSLGPTSVRRGAGDALVYVATDRKDRSYRLLRLPPPFAKLFTDAFGRMSITKPLHGLLVGSGAKATMPRLYQGEPTPEAFAKAVGELAGAEPAAPFLPASSLADRIDE